MLPYPSMKQEFRLARNMAFKSTSRFRLGAVLTKKRTTISTGINRMWKTHPINKQFNPQPFDIGQHAEINACLGVDPVDLVGAEVYVYRILRNGSQALAKPCQMCKTYLKSVGIKNVYYTTATGYGRLDLEG